MLKGDPDALGRHREVVRGRWSTGVPPAAGERVAVDAAREVAVERLFVSAYTVPTDEAESDGTLEWESTTIVVVEVGAGGETRHRLHLHRRRGGAARRGRSSRRRRRGRERARGRRAPGADGRGDPQRRTPGRRQHGGLGGRLALWDLKAKLLGISLADALGRGARRRCRSTGAAGSARTTRRATRRAARRLGERRHPARQDEGRPRAARRSRAASTRRARRSAPTRSSSSTRTAPTTASRRSRWARALRRRVGVTWFEEPVSSDDLEGLRLLRDRGAGRDGHRRGRVRLRLRPTSATCSRPARSTASRPTSRAAAAITGLLRAARARRRARDSPLGPQRAAARRARAVRRPAPAPPRVLPRPRARSSGCSSTASSSRRDGALRPDRDRPGHGLELRAPTRSATA